MGTATKEGGGPADARRSLEGIGALLGLAFYWSTSMVFFDSGLFSEIGLSDGVAARLFPFSIFAITVVTLAVVAVAVARPAWRCLRPPLVVGAALVASACVAVMLLSSRMGLPEWTATAAAGGMGGGAAVIMLAWGTYVCRRPTKTSLLIVPGGFFLSCIFQWAKGLLTTSGLVVFDALTFVFSSLAWVAVVHGNGAALPQAAEAGRALRVRGEAGWLSQDIPWKTVAVFFCCTLVGSIVERASGAASAVHGAVPGLVASGVLLAAALWVVMFRKKDALLVWPVFVLVLLGSLMVLPVAGVFDQSLVLQLIVAEKRCLVALLWMFLAGLVFRNELPAIVAFGLGHVLLQSLPNFMGQTIGGVLAGTFSDARDIDSLAMVMAFVIVVALVVALFDKSMLLGGLDSARPPEGGAAVGTAERVGSLYGLSQREQEVMELLLRGHTFPRISDELGVSINTIRTHSRNIYHKLNVHTKQELIDLVEGQAPPSR